MEGGSNHLKESLHERPSQQKRAIDDGGNGSDWEAIENQRLATEAGAKTAGTCKFNAWHPIYQYVLTTDIVSCS